MEFLNAREQVREVEGPPHSSLVQLRLVELYSDGDSVRLAGLHLSHQHHHLSVDRGGINKGDDGVAGVLSYGRMARGGRNVHCGFLQPTLLYPQTSSPLWWCVPVHWGDAVFSAQLSSG